MEWINVKDKLPKSETKVLVLIENNFGTTTIAIGFYEDGNVEEEESCFDWDYARIEYDEKKDANIIPESWYEYSVYGDGNEKIIDRVTHWMPLPEKTTDTIA